MDWKEEVTEGEMHRLEIFLFLVRQKTHEDKELFRKTGEIRHRCKKL